MLKLLLISFLVLISTAKSMQSALLSACKLNSTRLTRSPLLKQLSTSANLQEISSTCQDFAEPTNTMTKPAEKISKFVLFGGGPSSVIPLTYLETQPTSKKTDFFGDPTDSLLMKARDPQKTILSVLKVAKQYKTYDNLLQHSKEHVALLSNMSKMTAKPASEVVNVFVWKNDSVLGTKRLLFSRPMNQFFVGKKSEGKNLTLKSFNKAKEPNGEFDVTPTERTIYELKNASEDVLLRSTEGTFFSTAECGDLEDIMGKSGDVIYLPTLFPRWKSLSESATEKLSDKSKVINRAGFKYPGENTNDLQSELNLDLYKLALAYCRRANNLNELQQQAMTLFERYVKVHSRIEPDSNLRNQNFLIVGGGRAAAEMARRLFHDVDHKNVFETLEEIFKDSIDFADEKILNAQEEYKNSIDRRRKNVVALDHRKLELSELKWENKKFQRLFSSLAYGLFFSELCKFKFAPESTAEATEYYTSLLEALQKLQGSDVSLEGRQGMYLMFLVKNLKNFLKTPTPDSEETLKYKLVLTNSRQIEHWPEEFVSGIADRLESNEFTTMQVGGAFQSVKWSEDEEERESLLRHFHLIDDTNDYNLGRIQEGVYREANLKFIDLMFTSKETQEEWFSQHELSV